MQLAQLLETMIDRGAGDLHLQADSAPMIRVGGELQAINGAVMTGRLIGGNLSVWATTIGTPWETDSRGAILFLEDVDERPYRIDRMLTHLRTAGKLEGLHALVFGRLHHCDSDPPGLLDEVLRDLFADTRFPVFTGMPAGHGGPNRAFPLGAEATISADAQSGFPVLTID